MRCFQGNHGGWRLLADGQFRQDLSGLRTIQALVNTSAPSPQSVVFTRLLFVLPTRCQTYVYRGSIRLDSSPRLKAYYKSIMKEPGEPKAGDAGQKLTETGSSIENRERPNPPRLFSDQQLLLLREHDLFEYSQKFLYALSIVSRSRVKLSASHIILACRQTLMSKVGEMFQRKS